MLFRLGAEVMLLMVSGLGEFRMTSMLEGKFSGFCRDKGVA